MNKLTSFLNGKKTYVLAALGGLVIALNLAGVIDAQVADQLLALLGFGGLAALRAGVAKSAPKK